MLKTIAAEWKDFETHILDPINAPPNMRREMRKAFYAGVYCMLSHCKEVGEDHVSEDEGVAHFEAIKTECEDFVSGMVDDHLRRN